MSTTSTPVAEPQLGRITWRLCQPGWWDAEQNGTYVGWSVAQQCRVRWKKGQPQQYRCGWYVFNDAINKKIGPFTTPSAAQRACPLA